MEPEILTKKELKERKKKILDIRYKGEFDTVLDEIGSFIKDLMFSDDPVARRTIGWAMHERGVVFQNKGMNWEAGMECLQDAFAYRKAIDDPIGQAYTIFQIPMFRLAYKEKTEDVHPDFQRAKPYVLQAISMLESKHLMMVATAEEKEDLGNMYQNLAYIYQQEGDDQQAMLAYKKALDFRKKIGDRRGTGITLARMAEIEEDFQKAERYLNKAYQIFDSIGDISRLKQVRETREKIGKKKLLSELEEKK
ncbi:MAG: tetratricopeptide repeat protein [bacterium]|nr:tetratricopeptide repeat protein [bacterium]